jgi:hypothetical protein
MAEPSGDAIRRGDAYCVSAKRLDGTTLELAEELCRRFQVDEGLGTVELSFQGGHFEYAWVKQRIRKDSLPGRLRARPRLSSNSRRGASVQAGFRASISERALRRGTLS